jgi:hypothetical protein
MWYFDVSPLAVREKRVRLAHRPVHWIALPKLDSTAAELLKPQSPDTSSKRALVAKSVRRQSIKTIESAPASPRYQNSFDEDLALAFPRRSYLPFSRNPWKFLER